MIAPSLAQQNNGIDPALDLGECPWPWNVRLPFARPRLPMMQYKASVTVPDSDGPERYAPCVTLNPFSISIQCPTFYFSGTCFLFMTDI